MLPLPISGYVLAGGRSSRMGTDKALLQLAGKPLIAHAVAKLRRICEDVAILSNNAALADYAPLVSDLHPGCGPIAGIEAALTHSAHAWNLILPVDMPFVPTELLFSRAAGAINAHPPLSIEMFTIFGRPQPALCFLYQEVARYIGAAIERGDFQLMAALQAAATALAALHNQPLDRILRNEPITFDYQFSALPGEGGPSLVTQAQQDAIRLWFENLNTPEDFALAEAHIAALDT